MLTTQVWFGSLHCTVLLPNQTWQSGNTRCNQTDPDHPGASLCSTALLHCKSLSSTQAQINLSRLRDCRRLVRNYTVSTHHCITIPLHYTALHCSTLRCSALHFTALHCTALHFKNHGVIHRLNLSAQPLNFTSFNTAALNVTAPYCSALHYKEM